MTNNPSDGVVTLGTVTDPTKAELIKNILADHGIQAEILNEHQAGFTGTFGIDIMIRQSDAARAKQVAEENNLF